jgi:large subunit ribosomal protein L9
MEIILLEDIFNLGYKDDIVKVKPGYARNFLLPTRKAIVANKVNKEEHVKTLAENAHVEQANRDAAKGLVEKLQALKISIAAKASEKGKIFGSVSTIQIAENLKQQGFEVDKRNISITDLSSLKQLGTYTATIRVYKDIFATVDFAVVGEA